MGENAELIERIIGPAFPTPGARKDGRPSREALAVVRDYLIEALFLTPVDERNPEYPSENVWASAWKTADGPSEFLLREGPKRGALHLSFRSQQPKLGWGTYADIPDLLVQGRFSNLEVGFLAGVIQGMAEEIAALRQEVTELSDGEGAPEEGDEAATA